MRNEKASKKVTADEWAKMPQGEWLLLENYVEDGIRYHELAPSGNEPQKKDTLKDLKAIADEKKIKYHAGVKLEELKALIEKGK